MEQNGLPGGIFSGATAMGSGILGLEMPIHQSQQQKSPQSTHLQIHHHNQNPQMASFPHHEGDPHHQTLKQTYTFVPKSKPQQLAPVSDEDEPGFAPDDGNGDAKRKMSPWQRMKWTDNMVRLLIMAVYYIGDEGGSEGTDPKKKPGGLLQKKGKWKSVSRAMMEKGFFVSPQQCEDKFNDLNKRYKRVNDIIGKGTACKVVENQSLLETMDHISPKMKEEVRKLLNSKHLFFREMCAYHNSCSGGGGAAGIGAPAHHSTDAVAESSQRCLHSSDNASGGPHLGRAETEGSKMVKAGSEADEEDSDDVDDDEADDDDDEDVVEGVIRGRNEQRHEDDDENDGRRSMKRPREEMAALSSPLARQLHSELNNVIQDGSRSSWEKRQWMKTRLMQLEERRLSFQCEAFELEKQQLKWLKYCGKKEREMEQMKLKNERMRLENERMVLLLRHKELEWIDPHQQQQSNNKRCDPCFPNS